MSIEGDMSVRKIVFLVSSLEAGGAERVATELCNSWALAGKDVTLIATHSGSKECFYYTHPAVRIKFLGEASARRKGGKGYFRKLAVLRRMIVDVNPDIVIAFLPNVNIAAILATAGTGIPCVIGERSDPLLHPLPRRMRLAARLIYRFADAVTVQTESVASRIGAVYPGLKRVTVLHNPIPAQLAVGGDRAPAKDVIRTRKVLIHVGRLSEEKCQSKIITVFVRLASKHADWDLHFVGDGPLKLALAEQIRQAGLSEGRIRLLGQSKAPWELMRNSAAFILASAYEGFPNALLEAVALGLPAISTDCLSGPRDISDNGRVVKLVPVDDDDALAAAVDEVLGSPSLRDKLGREGADFVRTRFSLPSVLGKWQSLFTSVVDNK